MKDVEQIHQQWKLVKQRVDQHAPTDEEVKCNRRNKTWFACVHFDTPLNIIYDQKRYIALLEKKSKTRQTGNKGEKQ